MSKRPRGRPKGSTGKATLLSPAQVRDALTCARRYGRHANRAEVALTLSIELGLRAIELAALTFGDVYGPEGGLRSTIHDLDQASLHVERREAHCYRR